MTYDFSSASSNLRLDIIAALMRIEHENPEYADCIDIVADKFAKAQGQVKLTVSETRIAMNAMTIHWSHARPDIFQMFIEILAKNHSVRRSFTNLGSDE